jgi:hypothetical protein
MTCNCPQNSPFHWRDNTTPTIFATDPLFKANANTGLTTGQIMTNVVRRKRDEGVEAGTIYGLSHDRDEALYKAKLLKKVMDDLHKNTHKV